MSQRMTLLDMVGSLRAHIGQSLSVAHGINNLDTMKLKLETMQRELYVTYDWPNQGTYENLSVSAGDAFVPNSLEIQQDQTQKVWAAYGSRWVRLSFGFGPEHVTAGTEEARNWPPQRWRMNPRLGMIELWPTPSVSGTVRITGPARLGPLLADDDMSTLDGTLIVLKTAATEAARMKLDDAPAIALRAENYLRSILANAGGRRAGPTSLVPGDHTRLRPGLDYIPSGV